MVAESFSMAPRRWAIAVIVWVPAKSQVRYWVDPGTPLIEIGTVSLLSWGLPSGACTSTRTLWPATAVGGVHTIEPSSLVCRIWGLIGGLVVPMVRLSIVTVGKLDSSFPHFAACTSDL